MPELDRKPRLCVNCYQAVHPKANVCHHCNSTQRAGLPERSGQVLKWIGGAAVITSLVLGVFELRKGNVELKRATLELNTLVSQVSERRETIHQLVSAAEGQIADGDLVTAQKLVDQAFALDPANQATLKVKIVLAMDTVRQFHSPYDEGVTEAIEPVLSTLLIGANSADRQLAADVLAHVGWANFLRPISLDYEGKGFPVQEYFRRSIENDPDNVFAHIMWSWVCLYNQFWGKCENTLEMVREHYKLANRSGRENAYVKELWRRALHSSNVSGAWVEYVALLSDYENNKVKLDAKEKAYYLRYIEENVNREEGNFHLLLTRLGEAGFAGLINWLGNQEGTVESAEFDTKWYTGYFLARIDFEIGKFDRSLQRLRVLRKDTLRYAAETSYQYSSSLFLIDRMIAEIRRIKRGWLEVKPEQLDEERMAGLKIPTSTGLLVTKVYPHSPAEQAGVEVGDVIISINGSPAPEGWVPSLLGPALAGDELRLGTWRGGGAIEVVVKLGEAPGAESFSWMDAKLADITEGLMAEYVDQALFGQVENVGGIVLAMPTGDARRDYDVRTDADGALVVRVAETTEGVKIQPGDMILEVEGEPVKSPAELAKTVKEICIAGRTTLNFRIWRQGERIAVPAGLCSES